MPNVIFSFSGFLLVFTITTTSGLDLTIDDNERTLAGLAAPVLISCNNVLRISQSPHMLFSVFNSSVSLTISFGSRLVLG